MPRSSPTSRASRAPVPRARRALHPAAPVGGAALSPDDTLDEALQPPGFWLMMMEARAPWELAALLAVSPWLHRLPAGDGHPVLVLPGLGASDASTWAVRQFLQRQGYTAHGWEQGFNLGPRPGVLEACRARLDALFARHREPVSLVGWSLGGIYARELAKEATPSVRCVITLGTPFAGHPRATNAWRFYEWMNGRQGHDEALLAQVRQPPPVPTTSIYSRTDGVVAWRCSVNPDRHPHTENIEVHASHIGMGMNPLALYAIADRLRQDPAHWRRFDAAGARRWFFKVALQPASMVERY